MFNFKKITFQIELNRNDSSSSWGVKKGSVGGVGAVIDRSEPELYDAAIWTARASVIFSSFQNLVSSQEFLFYGC